jgi:hypothetical protein
MQPAIAPLRPMVPQFLPLSGQIESPIAGRWHTLHPISFASRFVPHAGPIIDGRRSPDKWRASRLGSHCGSEPCSLGHNDNPRRQSDGSSRLMTVMISPPLPSDAALPTISTSALGQTRTSGDRRTGVRFHLESRPDLAQPVRLKCAMKRHGAALLTTDRTRHLRRQNERALDDARALKILMRLSTGPKSKLGYRALRVARRKCANNGRSNVRTRQLLRGAALCPDM